VIDKNLIVFLVVSNLYCDGNIVAFPTVTLLITPIFENTVSGITNSYVIPLPTVSHIPAQFTFQIFAAWVLVITTGLLYSNAPVKVSSAPLKEDNFVTNC